MTRQDWTDLGLIGIATLTVIGLFVLWCLAGATR